MKRASFTLLVVLTASVFISAVGQKRRQRNPCSNPQTQSDMNICAGKAFKAADAVLNRVYQQLMAKLEAGEQPKLKEAEAAWLKYRDANCDYEAAFYEGGSIQPLILSGCLARVTKARTVELRQQLKDLDQ